MKYIKILLIIFTILCFSACKEFLDVNVSPNSPLSVGEAFVLPSAQANIGFTQNSDVNRFSSLFMQQFVSVTGVQTGEFDKYLVTASDVNGTWSNYYQVSLADLQYIIERSTSNGNRRYAGVSRILMAYVFQNIVDVWGDVPYSEALKGVLITRPKYDDSEDIYTDLISVIDQGIADIKSGEGISPGADDLIYAGDLIKWEKFANTLKLRIYLHYSEVNPTFATTQMNALINGGAIFMTSNADNFQLTYETTAGRQNPFHQFETSRPNQIFPSRTIVNLMNSKSDPRRALYFTPTPLPAGYTGTPDYTLNTYVGLENAVNGGAIATANVIRMHSFIRGAVTSTSIITNSANVAYAGNSPTRMLTYSEYNFIRAEASLRLGVVGTAQTFYAEGIRSSMQNAGVPTATIDSYIATSAGTLDNLQELIEEKYVANYGVAVEPWTDWRRTGFPVMSAISSTVSPSNGGVLPSTLFYPQNEIDSNPNKPVRTNMNTRVFWDTRTR